MERVNTILSGDALVVLKQLPSAVCQCCVTSPPYYGGLRDYGGVEGQIGIEITPKEYISKLVEVFAEVKRVLKDDGTLWINLGDSYGCSVMRRIHTGLASKQLLGMPWRVALALQDDDWYLRSDIIWHKTDATPESVKDRPTKAHEYLFLLSKSPRYFYDIDAVREPQVGDEKTFYAKRIKQPHKQVREYGSASYALTKTGFGREVYNPLGRNRRTVWSIATQPYKGAHFAVMPTTLVRPCILAGSRLGDLVLDPFLGSGTVAVVAKELGRSYLGIDLNPDYVRLAEERVASIPPSLWQVSLSGEGG